MGAAFTPGCVRLTVTGAAEFNPPPTKSSSAANDASPPFALLTAGPPAAIAMTSETATGVAVGVGVGVAVGAGTGVGVAVGFGVGVGVGVAVGVGVGGGAVIKVEPLRTSMPITTGWSAVPLVNAITICPLLLAIVGKLSTRAAFFPTCAKISKFDSAVVPLIDTLKTRCAVAFQ